MSHKAFYQTFFQTEQLFRRADDALSFPALADLPPEELVTDPALVDERDTTADLVVDEPAVQISAPVVPALPVPEPPVLTEAVAPPSAPEPAILIEPVAPPVPVMADSAERDEATPTPVSPPRSPQERRPATPLISQKVLIMVDQDLAPSDLLFLEKILNAINLDVQGVDLLNVHGTKHIDFSELLKGKHIHHFFTFGVPFTHVNLDIMMDRYQPIRYEGITFLMADPLPAIEADVILKKKLWESLKKVFLWR